MDQVTRRRFLLQAAGLPVALAGVAAAQDQTPPAPTTPEAPLPPSAARYVSREQGQTAVNCLVCPRACKIETGTRGLCQAYGNVEGTLQSVGYGNAAKVVPRRVEQEHFFHYLPGSQALFVGTPSCNLHCTYCNEWRISQFPIEKVSVQDAPPAALVAQAAQAGVRTVGFSFNDPAVAVEYVLDTAQAVAAQGGRTIAHTAGYVMPPVMKDLCAALAAVNVDIKCYTDATYKSLAQGTLQPVLDAIKAARETPVWLELTYLVVPGQNDEAGPVGDLCKWILDNCGADTPLHFVRFVPEWQHRAWQTPMTPVATLKQFRETAYKAGLRWVYTGNVPGDSGESTYCPNPQCNAILIRRIGPAITLGPLDVAGARCHDCGTPVPGVWQ